MIVAPASTSRPCVRLQVGIPFAGAPGIVGVGASRYRGVLDYRTSVDGVSVMAEVSRAKDFVTRTYLQWSRPR